MFDRRPIYAIFSRQWQFIAQGGLIAMCAAFGSTLAASLFLSTAGAAAIPVYYILFSALSIPASILSSAVIDRWHRKTTLTLLLIIYMAISTGLSLFINGNVYLYYILYLIISVCELMMYSVYYIMFYDYFTVVEGKRHSGAMTIALSAGAVVGALLITLLTQFAEARRVFLVLPVLIGITLAHLTWLTRREHPLDEPESAVEEGIFESLKALPIISRRYPIVLLLAGSMFINIAVQCVMEYEAFSIYAATFPEPGNLASFLGKMTAVVDIVGILIVFFVSNPLIPRLGVARMNLLAPAVNIASFLVLVASSGLPAGILAHLNYYSLEHNLNVPVFALTYNAIPHRVVGRVRVINDGIVYPLALAGTGLLLLRIEHSVSLSVVAFIGAGGAGLYLLVQWGLGRGYLRSLVDMLRSGAVDLEQVGEGFVLPEAYRQDVLDILRSDEPELVSLGIELACRCDIALDISDLERALTLVPADVARSALSTAAQNDPARAEGQLRLLVGSAVPRLQAIALEALVVRRFQVEFAILLRLIESEDETVRAVAAASWILSHPAAAAAPAAHRVLAGLRSEHSALAALRVLRALDGSAVFSVLQDIGAHPAAAVRAEALTAAAATGGGDRASLMSWARAAFADPDPSVRGAAIALQVQVAEAYELSLISREAFVDRQSEVRRAAALALGRRGGDALSELADQLRRADHDTVTAVMDGIGVAGEELADRVLFAFLAEAVFPLVARNLRVVRRLPVGRPAWRTLEVAIADSNAYAVQTVLHALRVLGYKRVLGVVRSAMKASDPRTRANAVETLSSLAHRRYVVPLLPLFEAAEKGKREFAALDGGDARKLLSELLIEADPYVCAAAMTVWYAEFGSVPQLNVPNPPPVVAATRCALSGRADPCSHDEEAPMNRLVFLKSVPLFSEMTLDNLMAVDTAMTRETYLPEERVVNEGEVGDKLYIVFSGEVAVHKRISASEQRELARLKSGQLFGEMALFDDEPRSATVVAVTDVELLALDGAHFRSLAFQRPEIPMQVCKVLVGRLRLAIA
jgi:Cyclic nucleotide-binding domain/Major Facilitator Superfamily